jgi:hypothetical protein
MVSARGYPLMRRVPRQKFEGESPPDFITCN